MLATPEIVGFAAAILTTVAFLPQAIKTLKTKQTEGISLTMLICQCSGNALWILYGIWIQSPSVLVANLITTAIVFSTIIAFLKNRGPVTQQ